MTPPLGMDHHAHQGPDPTEADPAFFAVVQALIAQGQHRTLEHQHGIVEIDAVLEQVGVVLGLVPFKVHEQFRIYKCTYRLAERSPKAPWVNT